MSGHEQAQEACHTGPQPYERLEAQKTEGETKSQQASEGMSTRKFEPINFLVAEDNPVNKKLFTKMITQLGHNLDLVVNGKEAVEAYKEGYQNYQCILMDLAMPVMGGLEATEFIRAFEDENGLKPSNIVALDAGRSMSVSEDKERLRKKGFTTVLQKPFRKVELNVVLEELGLLREAPAEVPPC